MKKKEVFPWISTDERFLSCPYNSNRQQRRMMVIVILFIVLVDIFCYSKSNFNVCTLPALSYTEMRYKPFESSSLLITRNDLPLRSYSFSFFPDRSEIIKLL